MIGDTHIRTLAAKRRLVVPAPLFRLGQGIKRLRFTLKREEGQSYLDCVWCVNGTVRMNDQTHRFYIDKYTAEKLRVKTDDDMLITETERGFTVRKDM